MVEYLTADEALDRAFHALAHPTRRAVLRRLAQGQATVTELARPFDVSLAAVSKHIEVLEAAGLARRTVEGRVHTLALRPDTLRTTAEWIAFYQRFWTESLARLDEALAEEESV